MDGRALGLRAQRLRRAAPDLKNRPELAIPLPMDDPSESIRSSSILPAVRRLFDVVEDRPYGGNILWFVFPCMDMARLREDETGDPFAG